MCPRRYLIAEANYGGRVTDELDRRVLASYLNKFYCEDVLAVPHYPLSPLPTYVVPPPGPLAAFKDYITGLPPVDPPEAFGQHPNAEISYLIEDSKVRRTLAACERLGSGGVVVIRRHGAVVWWRATDSTHAWCIACRGFRPVSMGCLPVWGPACCVVAAVAVLWICAGGLPCRWPCLLFEALACRCNPLVSGCGFAALVGTPAANCGIRWWEMRWHVMRAASN